MVLQNGGAGRFGFTHLYTSLMHRALDTGHKIAQHLDMPLRAWVDIHERGGLYVRNPETDERIGFPGFDRRYLERHYPLLKLNNSEVDKGWWNRSMEEESAVQVRVERVIKELMEKHGGTNDRVAIISHGGFFNSFLNPENSSW